MNKWNEINLQLLQKYRCHFHFVPDKVAAGETISFLLIDPLPELHRIATYGGSLTLRSGLQHRQEVALWRQFPCPASGFTQTETSTIKASPKRSVVFPESLQWKLPVPHFDNRNVFCCCLLFTHLHLLSDSLWIKPVGLIPSCEFVNYWSKRWRQTLLWTSILHILKRHYRQTLVGFWELQFFIQILESCRSGERWRGGGRGFGASGAAEASRPAANYSVTTLVMYEGLFKGQQQTKHGVSFQNIPRSKKHAAEKSRAPWNCHVV